MKIAKAKDHWRHVASKKHPFRILSIELSGIRGIGSAKTSLDDGSVLAICGHNGSGKTTLMRCIYTCLFGVKENKCLYEQQSYEVGKVKLSVRDNDSTNDIEITFPEFGKSGPSFENVFYLEPSANAPELVKKLKLTPDLGEIIQTAEARELNVDNYSYAVGKQYNRILAYEIEISEETIPYFEVEAYGVKYGSEMMGLGEFSVFYLLWFLNFIDKQSIVLIEEPEAFISPRSQVAVANLIAKFTDEKRLFTIMTTHSPQILAQIPPQCVRILVRDGSVCRLIKAENKMDHLAVLGIQSLPMNIAFVEDKAAKYALESILRLYVPGVLSELSVVPGGSWSQIISTLDGIPVDGHPIRFICLLDADRRGKNDECSWPLLYMPGNRAPDYHMLEAITNNMDCFAAYLGKDSERVRMHMVSLSGTDPHDYPVELSRLIEVDESVVYRAMADCWVNDEKWKAAVSGLAVQIREMVS